jgi:cell wall-associated NlpC family hydrolase
MRSRFLVACALSLLLAACASVQSPEPASRRAGPRTEVTLFALSLIDTGYRFGGKNPEAGLDCSGMVAYIYRRAAALEVKGSAADIARQGRAIERETLRPGDLVFFNTSNSPHSPYSHVGLYIGENRFVHAPSTNGRVRIDELSSAYYARRFTAARSYFD